MSPPGVVVRDAPARRSVAPLRAVRRRTAQMLLDRMVRACTPLPPEIVECPAVVLAPHPDDEVLGCGGLILRKRQAGVPVTVVFVTDGASSHANFTDRSELAAQRRREARSACAALGVMPESVHFLDMPDGDLGQHVPRAASTLDGLLRPLRPRQLVVPHPADPQDDHVATFRVADRWTAHAEHRPDLLLYPVWLWDQWPFTNPFSAPRRRSAKAIARSMLAGRGGARLGRLFDHCLDISQVLPAKRTALAEHASQTLRPPAQPDWPTLQDVAGGDWLDTLLQPVELYALR